MAGSPRYIYRGLTAPEIMEIRAATLARIKDGAFTNLSGAQKSSSREYVDAQDTLFECNAALGLLGVTGFDAPPSTVYEDLTAYK